jgi:hypothetical protein
MWTAELPGVAAVKLGKPAARNDKTLRAAQKRKGGTNADGLRGIQAPGTRKIIHRAYRSTRS